MIQVTFEAETIEGISDKAFSFLKAVSPEMIAGSNPVSPTISVLNSGDKSVEPVLDSKKPGRKKKTETELQVARPVPAAVPFESEEITKKDVIDILQQVSTIKNLPTAKEVLAQFGCARISDIKPEQYSDFVAACRKAIE